MNDCKSSKSLLLRGVSSAVVVAVLGGCSGPPSESEAQKDIVNYYHLNGPIQADVLRVESFQKTNGVMREINGQKVYTMSVQMKLGYPKGINAFCQNIQQFMCGGFTPDDVIKGKFIFESTEKGWRLRGEKGGGCFLTTAACQYKGLADNCHELEVLRQFRDEYLLATDEGRQLVALYYLIAPKIAERLVRISDLEEVWRTITDCVALIEAARYQEAVHAYQKMVRSLQTRFFG